MDEESRNRGKQLRFARCYRGLTQRELSGKIKGLTWSHLSKYENGFDTISEGQLKSVMIHLNFPFGWLDVKHPQIHGID